MGGFGAHRHYKKISTPTINSRSFLYPHVKYVKGLKKMKKLLMLFVLF